MEVVLLLLVSQVYIQILKSNCNCSPCTLSIHYFLCNDCYHFPIYPKRMLPSNYQHFHSKLIYNHQLVVYNTLNIFQLFQYTMYADNHQLPYYHIECTFDDFEEIQMNYIQVLHFHHTGYIKLDYEDNNSLLLML